MLKVLFKPIAMSFGLTNSLTTFQAIVNEILKDPINTGEIASFINDVTVKTEEEKGYDKIIENIVKRLEKNELYIKLENCK